MGENQKKTYSRDIRQMQKIVQVKIQNQQNRQPTLMELGFTIIIPEDLDDVTEREPD